MKLEMTEEQWQELTAVLAEMPPTSAVFDLVAGWTLDAAAEHIEAECVGDVLPFEVARMLREMRP